MAVVGRHLLAAIVLALAVLAAVAGPAAADIVFATGGGLGGDIYAMDDNGANVRLLAAGKYEKPSVAPDGTVLYTDAYNLMFPSGAVHAYKDGVSRVLASDFDGAADDVDVGYAGRYVFLNVIEEAKDALRSGQLAGGVTAPLSLCQMQPAFDDSGGSGIWENTDDEPQDPAVNPVRDEFLYSNCTWRRLYSNDTYVLESIDYLTLVHADGSEHWLIQSDDGWVFNDASWAPDGNSAVFLYWRFNDELTQGGDPRGLVRDPGEGIYVSAFDGTWRQPLTMYTGDASQNQWWNSPRLTADGRIVFGFRDHMAPARDGIYAIPASCDMCTMADATLLDAGGTDPAWTPAHIAAPSSQGEGTPSPPVPGPVCTDPSGSCTPVIDTTPPVLRLSSRFRQRAGKTVRVIVEAASEDTFVSASGRVSIAHQKHTYKLKATRTRLVTAGHRLTLKLTVPSRVRRAIAKALRHRRKVSVKVTIRARDRVGNRTTGRRMIRLRLKRGHR